MTTERAPVAGQGNRGGMGARSGNSGRSFLEGLVDPARGAASSQMMEQLLGGQGGRPPFGLTDPATPIRGGQDMLMGSGAAAAAGVLTAVDEDGEGDEEAQMPNEFDYFTDGEDDEE